MRWRPMKPIRVLVMSLLIILGDNLPLAASSRADVRKLFDTGMRVKIEARPRGETIYEADEVELKGEVTGEFAAEGICSKVDTSGGYITVAGIFLPVDPRAQVFDSRGGASALQSIKEGTRINAKFTKTEDGSYSVVVIEELDSRDQDVELKAPIEHLFIHGRTRMDVILLNRRFVCDETTAFIGPDGKEVSLDFAELDAYRRLVDSDEERPASRLAIGELLSVGGEVQVDLVPEGNFDLDQQNGEDVIFSRLSSRIELSSKPHPQLDLFLKFSGQEPMSSFDPLHPARSEGDVNLAEAYVLLRKLGTERLGLKIGRQDFDEPREWLYDENLDALRLYVNLSPATIEMSASTNFSESLVRDEGVINYILYSSLEMWPKSRSAVYLIHREDDDAVVNYDRRWYGARSFGNLGKSIEYWGEMSFLRGERRGREIRAYAYDFGFTSTFKRMYFEPSVTLGYAFGSGDSYFRDGVDGNFRQTGFDDNNDKFNGVNSFRYYGELLDPELSNIRIVTFGIGTRMTKKASFDLVYHVYRQVVPEDGVHGSNLLIDPSGETKALGEEIDLVFGYERLWNFDLELVVGFFRPGPAYDPNTDTASLTKLQVEYNF